LDLSEQDALSCSGAGSCKGGFPGVTLDYYTSDGVVDEACFPYTAKDDPCSKCTNPDEIIKINGKVMFSDPKTEEKLKKMIIDYGPVSGGIYSWKHAMALVGYGKDTTDGKTFWIFKNSWGNWGDHGYGYLKIEISDIGWTHALLHPVFSLVTPYEINCFDYDGDGYYNWGISALKPSSCPASALPDKDCDDSNRYLGPFEADGHCVCDGMLNLNIENQTLSTTETFEACETITAGPAVTVTSTGDVTFQAGKRAILKSGFSVEDGGRLSVIIDPTTGRLP
jgi:hypothetical protein